ncbi:molybdenum cofactor guanylyltransferase [Paenibacillus sp. GYB003]|uniref:molybdenum cofactor guanylyltransferase n=1 Tax=Paenibacillus sp. GYB003 TaxID=2994392 RepID=UPI002F96860C
MLTGVVLAGGKNRRMGGRPKALLTIGGETLVERQIRLMSPVCGEIVIVANDGGPFAGLAGESVRVAKDVYPDSGPLGGIHAALSAARGECAWIVGCDMPFVSADAAAYMRSRLRPELDAVVPRIAGRLQPLHAVYRTACAAAVRKLLEAGTLRVTALLDAVRWEAAEEDEFVERGIDSRFAVNANTPEEWSEALRMDADASRRG